MEAYAELMTGSGKVMLFLVARWKIRDGVRQPSRWTWCSHLGRPCRKACHWESEVFDEGHIVVGVRGPKSVYRVESIENERETQFIYIL